MKVKIRENMRKIEMIKIMKILIIIKKEIQKI